MALLERGKEYQSSKRLKIIEKESEEISKCSFKPQINTYTGLRKGDVHEVLYEIGRKRSCERRQGRDRSSEEVDFLKSQEECTFKPNTDKPDLLKLNDRAQIIRI